MESQQSENKSSVQNLREAMDAMINSYANNLKKIAIGDIPETPTDEKEFERVLKLIEKFDNFDKFERMSKTFSDEHIEGGASDIGNPFEKRSKVFKETKLNGK